MDMLYRVFIQQTPIEFAVIHCLNLDTAPGQLPAPASRRGAQIHSRFRSKAVSATEKAQ